MINIKNISRFIFTGSICWLAQSCEFNNAVDLYGMGCTVEETTYSEDVSPIIQNACIGCHNNSNTSGSLSLEGYDLVKKAALDGELLNRIKQPVSSPALMPPGSPLDSCTIEKIAFWIDQGAPNN